jgi:hypothetical protein
MSEYVFVEFRCDPKDVEELHNRILALDEDFVLLTTTHSVDHSFDKRARKWSVHIEGKIREEYATVLKLQDHFLAERMRVSSIADDLKNKYRRK